MKRHYTVLSREDNHSRSQSGKQPDYKFSEAHPNTKGGNILSAGECRKKVEESIVSE